MRGSRPAIRCRRRELAVACACRVIGALNRRRAAGRRAARGGGRRTGPSGAMSWVAITTVVPDLLSSMNSRSSRCARLGSTLPVGSSASSSCGRAITARAIAARCFSPPESTGGSALHALAEPDPVQQLDHLAAVARPRPCPARGTAARRSRRWSCDRAAGNPGTRCRSAAAAPTSASLRQRDDVVAEQRDQAARRPAATGTAAAAATSCRRPDGPVRNWNEFGSMWKVRSRRTSGPSP